ncbi:MAG: lysophospholipid acyltransferase family protein [Xanthomonadales bacterium]|nr:lysophospholipid acyltransferase family protein [Xanthomonadales bacterium]
MSATLPQPDELPEQIPHARDNLFRRACRGVLRLAGWQLRGQFPDCPRLVLIVAPHSSWWDGFWGLLFKAGMGVNIAFIGKHELFVGPLGWLLKKLGGMPVDRTAHGGVVGQRVQRFASNEPLWLGIAPEGTRKPVARWKTGFWHIAHAAKVPVLPVYFHYPQKTIGVGPLIELSDDCAADLARLRAFYAPWQGKNRNVD